MFPFSEFVVVYCLGRPIAPCTRRLLNHHKRKYQEEATTTTTTHNLYDLMLLVFDRYSDFLDLGLKYREGRKKTRRKNKSRDPPLWLTYSLDKRKKGDGHVLNGMDSCIIKLLNDEQRFRSRPRASHIKIQSVCVCVCAPLYLCEKRGMTRVHAGWML